MAVSVAFQPSAAGGTVGQGPSFSFGTSSLAYQTINVTIGATGTLSGTGQGRGTSPSSSDTSPPSNVALSISLTGVPDNQWPGFDSALFGGVAVDPFTFPTVVPTEPLPPNTRLTFVNLRGDRVDLAPRADQTVAAFSFEPALYRMLRYGEQYSVMFDGIVDFAGNVYPPGGTVAFTTAAAPPLVAEDGFESATGTTLASAQVLSGSGAPTITGARSLYIPPIVSVFPPSGSTKLTQLALRLALAPGDTVVRFSYRTVNPSSFGGATFQMGSEGGQIVVPTLSSATQSTTTATIPGQGSVMLGPITTGEFALPPDAAGEITLIRFAQTWASSMPSPPVTGLIIDDLRAE